MSVKDLPIVVQLYQAANLFAQPAEILQWTKKGLKDFPAYNLVYLHHQQIVGAISAILVEPAVAMIQDIAVAGEQRGSKIGEKLLQELLQRLRQSNIKTVKLWVYWKNARAIPFYYRCGFRLTHIEKAKNIPGLTDGEELLYLSLSF